MPLSSVYVPSTASSRPMNRYYPWAIITGIAAIPLVVQQVSAQPRNLYEEARQFVVLIQDASGARQGTGFIVNEKNNTYYVLTAAHVVRSGSFQIRTNSGEVKPVDVVRILGAEDLALVEFTSNNQYPIARLANNADEIQARVPISILGYPSSERSDPQFPSGTVTSRQRRPPGAGLAIIHGVETKDGMSGSPVLNERGEVVGIHVGLDSSSFRVAIPIESYRQFAPSAFIQAARNDLAASRFPQVIASIESAERLGGQEIPEAASLQAYAYFGSGDFDRARQVINRIRSNDTEAIFLLGVIDYLQGNFRGAIDNLSRTTNSIYSRYVHAILGLSYSENQSTRRDANNSIANATNSLQNESFIYLARSCVNNNLNGITSEVTADLAQANRLGTEISDNPYLAVIISKLQQHLKEKCLSSLIDRNPPELISRIEKYPIESRINLDDGATALAISSDNRFIAVGLENGNVSVYNLRDKVEVASFSSGQSNAIISSVAFNSDNTEIAIGSANGLVKVFSFQSRRERYTVSNTGNQPRIIFSKDNRYLFIGSEIGILRMADNRNNGRIIATESNAHPLGITSLTLSPDDRLVVSGGGDGVIRIWDASSLTPVDNYSAHQRVVLSLAFSTNGSQIISAGLDDLVQSCNWRTKQCTTVSRSNKEVIRSLAVASNGHIAFSAENGIFIRDQTINQSFSLLSGHRGSVNALAYTSNNEFLISGSSDKTIIIWKVQ